jgi:hypothetical protein
MDTAFEARVMTSPTVSGWGRTEAVAVRALADRLRAMSDERALAGTAATHHQHLVAATLFTHDDLVDWLHRHAEPTVLASSARWA